MLATLGTRRDPLPLPLRCQIVWAWLYSTRADTYVGDMTGGSYDLSYFSGRGPRIDGVSLLDIAAPGTWTSSQRLRLIPATSWALTASLVETRRRDHT